MFYKSENIRLSPESNINKCQSRLRASVAKIAGCNFLFGPRIEKGILTEDDSNFDEKIKRDLTRDFI